LPPVKSLKEVEKEEKFRQKELKKEAKMGIYPTMPYDLPVPAGYQPVMIMPLQATGYMPMQGGYPQYPQ